MSNELTTDSGERQEARPLHGDRDESGERNVSKEYTLCEETGLRADEGGCYEHGGDACLRQYRPVERPGLDALLTALQEADEALEWAENLARRRATTVWPTGRDPWYEQRAQALARLRDVVA